MGLYFNADELPQVHGEYVLWCDGMGTGGALSTSLSHVANFVFKLHRAFGDVVGKVSDARLYPLMDGMYVTSVSRDSIQTVIRNAFVKLAKEFVAHADVHKHFIVRAAVAYGATLHGSDVPDEAFVYGIGTEHETKNRKAFSNSTLNQTRSALLLSSAMAIAYHTESIAPPFGVYVHDSALSVPQLVNPRDGGFPSHLWSWWRGNAAASTIAKKLAPAIEQYFTQAEQQSRNIDYPLEAINKHREALSEYFGDYLPKK